MGSCKLERKPGPLFMGIWDLPGGGPKVSMGSSVRATSNQDLAPAFPSSPQARLLGSRNHIACPAAPTPRLLRPLRQPHDHTPPPQCHK